MKFEIESWPVHKIIEYHSNGKLNLSPPYQRNNIWVEKAQKTLISSMREGLPLPTFFLHNRGKDNYDVADGQQRIRAILAYINGEIVNDLGKHYSSEQEFLDYLIPVVIIDQSISQESIREFYVMVNNTGLRLNKPELTKASHFDSATLNLVEELTNIDDFKTLGIFTDKQSDRMVDRDFVEELVAQLKYGIGDKKNDVKKLYNENITSDQVSSIKNEFKSILSVLTKHKEFDIASTRYSQRNDFYTLFGFTKKYIERKNSLSIFYEILKKIQYDISPSNDNNSDLQFYAINCVSQSNSKAAREDRLTFMEALLANETKKVNKIQKSLLKYYKIAPDGMIVTKDGFMTINPARIESQFKKA